MGFLDQLAPAIAAKFGVPHAAARGAIALVAAAHAGDQVATQKLVAAVQGPSSAAKDILAATYQALKAHPAFWTAHYVTQAQKSPLHPSHPYAQHIRAGLARIGAPALPPIMAAGRGHGGGGGHGHGGGRGHARVRKGGRDVYPGAVVVYDGPYFEGPDYVLESDNRVSDAESPGVYGGPETAPDWQKGGN